MPVPNDFSNRLLSSRRIPSSCSMGAFSVHLQASPLQVRDDECWILPISALIVRRGLLANLYPSDPVCAVSPGMSLLLHRCECPGLVDHQSSASSSCSLSRALRTSLLHLFSHLLQDTRTSCKAPSAFVPSLHWTFRSTDHRHKTPSAFCPASTISLQDRQVLQLYMALEVHTHGISTILILCPVPAWEYIRVLTSPTWLSGSYSWLRLRTPCPSTSNSTSPLIASYLGRYKISATLLSSDLFSAIYSICAVSDYRSLSPAIIYILLPCNYHLSTLAQDYQTIISPSHARLGLAVSSE